MSMTKRDFFAVKLASHAGAYAEMTKWLSECPAQDGQPFYETASEYLAFHGEEIAEKAHMLLDLGMPNAEQLVKDIEAALEDSEWGGLEEWDFWFAIKKRAETMVR